MRFNVIKEGDLDAARKAPAKGCEQEQRHPREQCDDYNPRRHTVKGRPHQSDTYKKLIEGASQH